MSIRDYIEQVRSKPEDARRRYALSAAGTVTGVVLVAWAVTLVSSGALALQSTGKDAAAPATFVERGRDVAGAASALSGAFSQEAEFTTVEEASSSTLDRQDTGEATVIPF